MIEILTKSQIKMKQQAAAKDQEFEERFVNSQKQVAEQIRGFCEKMDKKSEDLEDMIDTKTEVLERKIEDVERNATNTLIKYLSESAFDRKR